MTVAIYHGDNCFYTNGTIGEVAKAINEGTVLTCWWFAGNGKRFEEDFLFYGDPSMLRTESDV